MKTRILLSFLFAVLFPASVWAESGRHTADGVFNDVPRGNGGQIAEQYQLAQAALNDGGVSDRLPFNFRNGVYMSRCIESSRREELDSAIEACSKAIELDPGNVFAHRLRGLAYAKKGDQGRAARDCEAAEKLGDGECRRWLEKTARGEDKKESTTFTLLCRISSNNGRPEDHSLVVDLASSTVDGQKATIDDNSIRWTHNRWPCSVDRYTGTFGCSDADGRAIFNGKCVKTEGERQF